ncbi:hypothetical protein DMUE_1156 [Dictyocoela muelleri]|nr:hypothetical protein DMUE_1156 [Dictyocoela muelleri]
MIERYKKDGTSNIVEIDKSLFFKRKYNRGRVTNGQWYLLEVERETKKAFIIPVLNRNCDTMSRIIYENILPGSIIITDQMRAYSFALQKSTVLEHKQINHSLNFVNPEDFSIHTQTIEGLWGLLKRYLRGKNGITKEQQFDFLIQFIWEQKIEKRKRFNCLLNILK